MLQQLPIILKLLGVCMQDLFPGDRLVNWQPEGYLRPHLSCSGGSMSERMGIGRMANTDPPIALSTIPQSIIMKFFAKACATAPSILSGQAAGLHRRKQGTLFTSLKPPRDERAPG